MQKMMSFSQMVVVSTLLALGLGSGAARAVDSPGLEAMKDRLRGSSSAVLKEMEEFYDECRNRSGGDPAVTEKTLPLLVGVRQFKKRVRRLASPEEARTQFQSLQMLMTTLKTVLEQSPLYQDVRVQKRWSDLTEVWAVFSAIALAP